MTSGTPTRQMDQSMASGGLVTLADPKVAELNPGRNTRASQFVWNELFAQPLTTSDG